MCNAGLIALLQIVILIHFNTCYVIICEKLISATYGRKYQLLQQSKKVQVYCFDVHEKLETFDFNNLRYNSIVPNVVTSLGSLNKA